MDELINLIILLGGGQVILTALIAFSGKMWLTYLHEKQKGEINSEVEQIKATLQATNLRLQAALEAQVHVHKLQFETELQIYREIWDILVEVRKVTANLRPFLDHVDPSETEEERKRERIATFGNAFQKFLDQVNKQRPFYPEEIYSKLHSLSDLVRVEAIEYQYDQNRDIGYWKKAQQNLKAINSHIDEICEAIRERIAKVSVP